MDILIRNARMTMLLEQDCKRQIHSLPVKTGSMKVAIFDCKTLRHTLVMHCFPLVICIQSTDLSIYLLFIFSSARHKPNQQIKINICKKLRLIFSLKLLTQTRFNIFFYDNRNPEDKHAKYKYPTLSASIPKLTCYVSYLPMNSIDLLNKECLLK